MTKTEKVLIHKMWEKGYHVFFHASGKNWVFLDSNEEITEERMQGFRDAGLGIAYVSKLPYLYYKDDYDYVNNEFVARKNIVYSVPVRISDNPAKMQPFSVSADVIDLSDFCYILSCGYIKADRIILGDDVRLVSWGVRGENLLDVFSERSYVGMRDMLHVRQIKLVGDSPVTNMQSFLSGNKYVVELDLTDVNIKECLNLENFCRGCANLKEVKIGEVSEKACCTNAFRGSGLPSYYTPSALQGNELKKIADIQSKTPCLYPVLDEINLKIAVTNLSETAMEALFPQYTCRICVYSGCYDSVDYPYAFLFPKSVPLAPEVLTYLATNYPEIVKELTGKGSSEILEKAAVSAVF